jgi:hypothetical protein
MLALLGAGVLCVFFRADAVRLLLEIKIATSAKRRTVFTQMDRAIGQRWLSCVTEAQRFLRLQSGKYVYRDSVNPS